MNTADEDFVREAVIESITMISGAMNDAQRETNYRVKKRDDLMQGMLKYIKITKQEMMKKRAMNTVHSLLYLQPPLNVEDELRKQVVDVTLKHLNNCKLPENAVTTDGMMEGGTTSTADGGSSNDDEKKEEAAKSGGDKEEVAADTALLQCMQTILIGLLETQPSVESLCQLIFKLEYWIVSKNINERICALETYKLLTKRFIGILRKHQDIGGSTTTKSAQQKEREKSLKNLGHYLATIIPRVTDNNSKVRELALDTIQMLLFIDQLLRNPGNEKPSDELRSLNALKKELQNEKIAETRLQKMYYLSEILCKLTSAEEMKTLLINLIRGVNDDDRQSALGTCKALQGILRERALETKQYVDKLLDINLDELKKFINDERKKNVLKQQLISICILTREHFDDILEILHNQSLPLDAATILVFKALAADIKLQRKVIDYELNVINTSPINDSGITKNVCIATKALQTMFTLAETAQICKSDEYYYQFLATLITRLGTAICKKAKAKPTGAAPTPDGDKKKKEDKKKKKKKEKEESNKKGKDEKQDDDEKENNNDKIPAISKGVGFAVADVITAIKHFLSATDERLLVTNMNEDGTWKKFENAGNYEDGVAELVDKWCASRQEETMKLNIAKRKLLFDAVMPYFKKHFVGHRNSAAVVVAELIRHTGNDKVFLDALVRELLPRISDGEPRVRRQGLVGLGNLSDVWSDELIPTAPAILSSLTSAIEDKIEIVCISAIKSLIKILRVIDVNTVQPSLINICFRTRPFLDSENSEVRQEAFKLFGKLCKFGVDNYNFAEQIHKNMACFICHINDVNEAVSKEAYSTLLIVFKYLGDDRIIQVLTPNDSGIEESCQEIIGKSNFNSFLVKFAPILSDAQDRKYYDHLTLYLQAAVSYMNSSRWGEVRGNAALFAAKIVQCVDDSFSKTHLDCNTVIETIMKLLQSKSARVRKRTAKSLSYLSSA